MEIKDFIANFAAQFDETEESVFTPETKFRELEEWSSLLALSIIATVLLSINILFTLISMINRSEINLALLFDVFALTTIWLLYSH